MRKAVALKYDKQKNLAPQIVASGQGQLAAQILKLAAEGGIPTYEHAQLVESLVKLPVGSEIPPELYELVARILAFVLHVDKQKSSNGSSDWNRQS